MKAQLINTLSKVIDIPAPSFLCAHLSFISQHSLVNSMIQSDWTHFPKHTRQPFSTCGIYIHGSLSLKCTYHPHPFVFLGNAYSYYKTHLTSQSCLLSLSDPWGSVVMLPPYFHSTKHLPLWITFICLQVWLLHWNSDSLVVMCHKSGVRLSGLQAPTHQHILDVWAWGSYVTSLIPSFLTDK